MGEGRRRLSGAALALYARKRTKDEAGRACELGSHPVPEVLHHLQPLLVFL